MKKCGWNENGFYVDGNPGNYDLYGAFGLSLGETPARHDPDIGRLRVYVVQIPEGEFYHLELQGRSSFVSCPPEQE